MVPVQQEKKPHYSRAWMSRRNFCCYWTRRIRSLFRTRTVLWKLRWRQYWEWCPFRQTCRWPGIGEHCLTQAPVFLPQAIPVPAPYPVTAPSALPLYPHHNGSPSLSPSTELSLCPYLKQSLSLYLKLGPFVRLYQYRNTSQSPPAYLTRYSRWCHPLAGPFENSGQVATRSNTYIKGSDGFDHTSELWEAMNFESAFGYPLIFHLFRIRTQFKMGHHTMWLGKNKFYEFM